jgi:hypothetical protein
MRLDRSLPAHEKIPVLCPFHDDHSPSATVFLENGWLYCNGCGFSGGVIDCEMRFSNCDEETAKKNIAEITGVSLNGGGWRFISEHIYRDREGVPVSRKRRYDLPNGKKECPWDHRDSKGRWQTGLLKGTPRPLYNLPETITANLLLYSEGEKCADWLTAQIPNLWPERQAKGLRIAATTSPDGAWEPTAKKPKWRDEYNKYFGGKSLVIFEDNDPNGRTLADHVAAQVYSIADEIRRISFPGKPEGYDIADWLEEIDPAERAGRLEQLIESAPLYKPDRQQAATASSWVAEGMDTFLESTDAEIAWLVGDVLAPSCLTQMFAPRGIGKSLLADHWAVKLASTGMRVLILDRDNPRHALRNRLRSLGAGDLAERHGNLKVISREKCPPLTKPDEWAYFPYPDYDVVIVDSLDAMAEGVGEQDSSKPARAMVPLLDICHRENGPAVLMLGNTVKTAEHSRGSGVVEDRADIVFEVRDATGFAPSGDKPWVEELPAQGASEWATRSSRRKGRTIFRLALVATKFRVGEEPSPRMFEVNMADEPWTVTDVTAAIDQAGETERQHRADEKAARLAKGSNSLLDQIDALAAAARPPILKTAAEAFLMSEKFTQKEARTIIASDSFSQIFGFGKGHPVEIHRRDKRQSNDKNADHAKPNQGAGFVEADFRCPHSEHTTEIARPKDRVNTGDFDQPISVVGQSYNPAPRPATEVERIENEAIDEDKI